MRATELSPLDEEVRRVVGVESTFVTEPEEPAGRETLSLWTLDDDVSDEFPLFVLGATYGGVGLDEDLTLGRFVGT